MANSTHSGGASRRTGLEMDSHHTSLSADPGLPTPPGIPVHVCVCWWGVRVGELVSRDCWDMPLAVRKTPASWPLPPAPCCAFICPSGHSTFRQHAVLPFLDCVNWTSPCWFPGPPPSVANGREGPNTCILKKKQRRGSPEPGPMVPRVVLLVSGPVSFTSDPVSFP